MKRIFYVLFALLFVSAAYAQPVNQKNHTIQRYLNIRSAGSPTLSVDGKRLAYLANVTGTSQIWMIDLPKGSPK